MSDVDAAHHVTIARLGVKWFHGRLASLPHVAHLRAHDQHRCGCDAEHVERSDISQHDEAMSALTDVDTEVWSRRFDLMSDPTRLEILLVLHREPGINVGDLATAVDRSENAVSQALRVLRRLGWVHSTRVGRTVSYELTDETAHDLLHWIGAKRRVGKRH